jgi:hypothetical protein
MKWTKGSGQSMKVQATGTVRASISFPPDIYESLEELGMRLPVLLRIESYAQAKHIYMQH